MKDIKELQEAIAKHNSSKVLILLKSKENILNQTKNEEEKQQIIASIVKLRRMDIMRLLARQLKSFNPTMFRMDMKGYANKDFMNNVLSKYRRKFDLEDENIGKWVMKTACTVGNRKMVFNVLKTRNGYCYLPYLAGAEKHIFEAVKTMVVDYIPSDVIIELLIQAAKEKDGEARLRFLKKSGYPLDTKDAKGRTAADLLDLKLMQKAKNRNEMLEQKLYRDALKRLKFVKREEKKNKTRKILIIMLSILIVSAGIGYGVWSVIHTHEDLKTTRSSNSVAIVNEISI